MGTITLKNMGKQVHYMEMRNSLLALQKNLLKCIAGKNSDKSSGKFKNIRDLLLKGKQDEAVEAMRLICF